MARPTGMRRQPRCTDAGAWVGTLFGVRRQGRNDGRQGWQRLPLVGRRILVNLWGLHGRCSPPLPPRALAGVGWRFGRPVPPVLFGAARRLQPAAATWTLRTVSRS